jgi:sulfoxide reductase catalytic subunit YedY
MRGAALAASATATTLLYRKLNPPPAELPKGQKIETATAKPDDDLAKSGFTVSEKPTPLGDITNYNNFYEFSTDKREVAAESKGFVTRPWAVDVGGLVNKPQVFDLDELLKFGQEERVYRFRCVEGWSMVIPWIGFPLAKLLEKVEPMSQARYVSFQTLHDPERLPNQHTGVLSWPYVEGLRLDEAMHPLAILATGLYGQVLPPQDGAPIRLVVPWKYGFKSIKSIVKIEFIAQQPKTFWETLQPEEYPFESNVNPAVPHPRWSQATERMIDTGDRVKTQLFNGYGKYVAGLYAKV